MSALTTTNPAYNDEINLRELIKTLWAGKLVIGLCTLLVTAASVAYALSATEIFRSQVSVQIRNEDGAGLASELGGLAALAGISVGTGDHNREFALTALTSRAVIQSMIEEENLLPILYADAWDAENERWLVPDPPTPWKAYELFRKSVLSVSVDRNTGVVTIGIEWNDPVLAASWVETLVPRVNTFVNDATVREAEQNLKFLDRQAQTTSVVELQKTIFSMMESEIKRLMVARNPETAPLRVIDPPFVPEQRVRPRRSLIGIMGILSGGLFGSLIILARSILRA